MLTQAAGQLNFFDDILLPSSRATRENDDPRTLCFAARATRFSNTIDDLIAVHSVEMSAHTVALVAVCVYTPIYALLVGSVPRKSGIGFVSRLRVYYSTTDWSFWFEW